MGVDANVPGDLRFDANGLIPAVVQDIRNGQVLMHAYMNAEALGRTLQTGLAHYYSRSRQCLWRKGEESGHVQRIREILYDCDADTLLLKVDQEVAACHTGNRSCFFRGLPIRYVWGEETSGRPSDAGSMETGFEVLATVHRTILDRKTEAPEGSYVASLFAKGRDQILKKILEESAEVLTASKDDDRSKLIYEMADLWFHTLVLLAEHGIRPEDIAQELARRVGKRKADYA
jgi:phosphoribosyl-ATP pyrophosphohydrolase/phosphoribosyl-AMP cyclohydrolase